MANGVETRGEKIRIYFNWESEKRRESLGLKSTPENIAYAEAKVAQINYEIKIGTFDYAQHFPKSRVIAKNTLGHYIDIWLDLKKQELADSTFVCYHGIINRYIRPKFAAKSPTAIDQLDIKLWMRKDLSTLASKTIKEALALLKQIFALYRTRHLNTIDPTAGLTITLPDDRDPDPFTLDEIRLITNTEPFDDREQELNLVQFLLWSGPRISEAIALAWEDVDLEKGRVNFKRARVRNYKCTKTKRSTHGHELISPALEALERQYKITGNLLAQNINVVQRDNRTIQTEKVRFVFLNTKTKSAHISCKSLRKHFFSGHLSNTGVRYRGPGQCRHTYISQMLTARMDLQWISKQTGTSVEMIRRKYGKWIEEDAPDMITLAEKRLGITTKHR